MTDDRHAALAVTGASGFIGRGVMQTLASRGVPVRGISRGEAPAWVTAGMQWRAVGSYMDRAAMQNALEGCEFILHLADDPQRGAKRSAHEIVAMANALVCAARAAGLRGLIVASSVYARIGNHSNASYGAGKLAAEKCFLSESSLPIVILRLPPVYGSGGRGGIATLSKLISRGVPLPFGLAAAQRNYLSRGNLCDLVVRMISAPTTAWAIASGRIFEPSDGQPISTRDLVMLVAAERGVRARLVPVPIWVLRAAARLVNREELVAGAVDPLDVDGSGELGRIFSWQAAEKMPGSLSDLRFED